MLASGSIFQLFYTLSSERTSSNPFMSPEDEQHMHGDNQVSSPSNPFLDDGEGEDNSDLDEQHDLENSIYDIESSQDFTFSRSSRKRTDSDSNMLYDETGTSANDEIFIGDMMEDHFGLPGDLTRLQGWYL